MSRLFTPTIELVNNVSKHVKGLINLLIGNPSEGRLRFGYFRILNLYSIITPFVPLKYHVFENILENGAFASFEANAPFSIIFSTYSKLNLFFPDFFSMFSKN